MPRVRSILLWNRRVFSRAAITVLAGFSVTALFGLLPKSLPDEVRLGGMLAVLLVISWLVRQGLLAGAETERMTAILGRLDDEIDYLDIALNELLATRLDSRSSVFRRIQDHVGALIAELFGDDQRLAMLDGAPRRNSFVDKELPPAEQHTAVVLYQRRLERLRTRVALGQTRTVDGFRVRP